MPDKKLTDKEIVKALEICQKPHDNDTCNNCKYKRNFGCRDALCNDILDLINRLEAEKEVLEARIGVYETCNARKDEAIKHLEAENERLKEENNELHKALTNAECNYDNMRLLYINKRVDVDRLLIANAEIKAEAYKEFAERLKEFMHNKFKTLDEYEFEYITESDIDNLIKEIIGE